MIAHDIVNSSSPDDWLLVILLTTIIFLLFMIFGGWALIILVAPLVFVVMLSALNGLILEPFAWLMERGDKGVKLVSFGLLLFGFHFDFLAS